MASRSNLWQQITAQLFSNVDEKFISSFRAPGGPNSRLAAWDPYDKSMRYYKFLLFNIALKKPDIFFQAYSRLKNTQIGTPVTVRIDNCNIDIDYLFSIEEYLFLYENLPNSVNRVVEIGAGFGRTCHALLTLLIDIDSYIIIDLPEILELSKTFLLKAIPEHYDKITFISNDDHQALSNINSDLVINIDSFQEMPIHVIDYYMQNIISKGKYFYSKNPIGKYLPENVGLPVLNSDQLQDVFSLGYSQNIYDLFDENDLKNGRIQYCIDYLPAGWKTIIDSPVEIFPYLHNVLYRNNT